MIYGMGCMFDSGDMLEDFVRDSMPRIGFNKEEANPLLQMFTQIGVGDIIYLKSFTPQQGLTIKAIGFVNQLNIFDLPDGTWGRSVQWAWSALQDGPIRLGRLNDKYDFMRGGTLFQEFGIKVQQSILTKIFDLMYH